MMNETLQTLVLHFNRADQAHEEISLFLDQLAPEALDDFEKVKVIDSFIFRFIKIQDLMGDKLFREFLMLVGEYSESMTMLDVLDKMEKFEMVDSASSWLDYRNLRNVLTHEYPDNREELIEGIKVALEVFPDMKCVYSRLVAYMSSKSLIGTIAD